MVGDHRPPGLFLVPPEGRDAVVVAVQETGLAGRRGRWQECLPAIEAVPSRTNPARQVGRPAGLDLASQDRPRETVDLDDDEARRIRPMDVRPASRQLLDEDREVRVVAADREDRHEDGVRDRVDERCDQSREPARDDQAVDEAGQDEERHDLKDEGRDRDRDDRDACEGGDEHGADQDVQDAQDDRREECRAEESRARREIDARRQVDGDAERQDAHDQGRRQPPDARTCARAPRPHDVDLEPVEVDQAAHHVSPRSSSGA